MASFTDKCKKLTDDTNKDIVRISKASETIAQRLRSNIGSQNKPEASK